MQEALYILMQQ